jgi:hypothetical protein
MKWEQLNDTKEGESLSLKGFLYQTAEGSWILSANPHLKSCCIGCSEKQHSQIYLSDEYSSFNKNRPLYVQGYVHKNSCGICYLEVTNVMQKVGFPLWTAGTLLLALLLCAFKLKRLLLP